jgi:ABC-type branched-subunit amino acid transport system ATPase component
MGAMLSIDGVLRAFGSTEVLKQIAIDIQARASFVFSARRDAEYQRCRGFAAQGRGSVSIGGRAVEDLDPRVRKLAMVFQSYALYPHMKVEENMSLPSEMECLSAAQSVPVVGSSCLTRRAKMTEIASNVRDNRLRAYRQVGRLKEFETRSMRVRTGALRPHGTGGKAKSGERSARSSIGSSRPPSPDEVLKEMVTSTNALIY